MTTPASHAQLRTLLGEAMDELTLDRIVETGATADDVAEALGYLESDEIGEPPARPLISAAAYEVRAILADALRDANDAEDADEVVHVGPV